MRPITKLLIIYLVTIVVSSYFYGRVILPMNLDNNIDGVSKMGCLDLDIMLVGDYSGSVVGFEPFVADAFEAFIDRIEFDEFSGAMVGMIIFGDYPVVISELTADKLVLRQGIREMRQLHAGENTAYIPVLKRAMYELEKGGRSDVQDMIILISDGNPTDYNKALERYLKELKGVLMCGVLIVNSQYDAEYMASILLPECYTQSDYNSLAFELERLDICL